jgi:exodeoxyribonuclease X
MRTLIFDCETTGVKDARLVEAAWVELNPGTPSIMVIDKFASRYNPGVPITCGAMATHHITDEDVADCPPASDFQFPPDTGFLIGHKIDFDWQATLACGAQWAKPKRICTLALSQSLWPEADSHSLAAMCYHLARPQARLLCRGSHGAETDVKLCRIVLFAILDRLKPATWDALWESSELARIPTHLTFGKHKGLAIKDVPRDYKDWLRRQPDVDPYLLQALSR